MTTPQQTYTVDLRNSLPQPAEAAPSGRFLGLFARHQRTVGFPVRDHAGNVVLLLAPRVKLGKFGYGLNTLDGTEMASLELGVIPGLITGLVGGSFRPGAGIGGELAWDASYLPSQETQQGGAPYRLVAEGASYIIANGPAADTFTMIAEDGSRVADGTMTRFDQGYQLESVTVSEYLERLPVHLLVGACWWRAQCRMPHRRQH